MLCVSNTHSVLSEGVVHSARIVVVGSANTDMVVRVPSLPRPGETVIGGSFFTARGGKGANQAVAAARAGGSVALIACLGDDALGDETLAALAADGIALHGVRRMLDTRSGVALILVDERGENSIAVAPGANALLRPEQLAPCAELLSTGDILLTQLETPLDTVLAAMRAAHRAGARTILNPAPATDLPDELLRLVSVLTPNEAEAARLTGVPMEDGNWLETAATALLKRGVGSVVITLGAAGAYIAASEFRETIPGWRVEPRDTTGAGDVFNGALAVALAEQLPLGEAVRFANAAAAISVTRDGAQPAAPRREEILHLYLAAPPLTGGITMTSSSTTAPIMTSQQFLEHWQGHRALTRRVIDAFPENELFNYSVGGMRPFSTLAMEFLGMAVPTLNGVITGQWSQYAGAKATTKTELLRQWDDATAEINALWPTIPAARFQEVDTAFGQWKMPIYDLLLYIRDNEIHHRGQGYVYLRSLGIEPPPFWERG